MSISVIYKYYCESMFLELFTICDLILLLLLFLSLPFSPSFLQLFSFTSFLSLPFLFISSFLLSLPLISFRLGLKHELLLENDNKQRYQKCPALVLSGNAQEKWGTKYYKQIYISGVKLMRKIINKQFKPIYQHVSSQNMRAST